MQASARIGARRPAPRFKASKAADGSEALTPADGASEELTAARLIRCIGATDDPAVELLMSQATRSTEGADLAARANAALALLGGIEPRSDTEAMMAVQMVAAHNLATAMARRALATDRLDCLRQYGAHAARFMGVFTRQVEALARLRGQTGQQTVRVEHVTVQAGGQAVVGAVSTRGRGGGDGS